jgi:hypothetical protein
MVYNIPKSKEWLVVNCVKNAMMLILLGFYIFKGERLKNNYIEFTNQAHVSQCKNQGMDDELPI